MVRNNPRPPEPPPAPPHYRFDPAGNRLDSAPGQASGEPRISDNRVTQLDGVAYQYDAAGNLVAKRWPDGARLALTYDGAHRLIRLQRTGADGSVVQARYEYDAFSRRVAKHVRVQSDGLSQGGTTRFGWEGEHLVHEETERPTDHGPRRFGRTTVYEPGGFVPLLRVERISGTAPPAAPVAEKEEQAQAWAQMAQLLRRQGVAMPAALREPVLATQVGVFHTDHLGTPLKLTDPQGATLWRGRNDDWGAVRDESGSTDQPIRFQGQWADDESGFFYNRNRYYDPDLGAYIHQDPKGMAGGINYYDYANKNSIANIDPLGLAWDRFPPAAGRTTDDNSVPCITEYVYDRNPEMLIEEGLITPQWEQNFEVIFYLTRMKSWDPTADIDFIKCDGIWYKIWGYVDARRGPDGKCKLSSPWTLAPTPGLPVPVPLGGSSEVLEKGSANTTEDLFSKEDYLRRARTSDPRPNPGR